MTLKTYVCALAALGLTACGAHALSLGGGASTSGPGGASSSSPSADSDDGLPDPHPEITAATDRVNAHTPNNAGRAKSYPLDDDDDSEFSYGEPWAQRGDGWFRELRTRYLILAGYTVEEATRRAKDAGFAGEIRVVPRDHFNPRCAAGTVCKVSRRMWQAYDHDPLTLYINPSVEISKPD